MKLLQSLMHRTGIATPAFDAQMYCLERAADNLKLGDITKLPYVAVVHTTKGWKVGDACFKTQAEARAYILRHWW